jgi:hypothetical protein
MALSLAGGCLPSGGSDREPDDDTGGGEDAAIEDAADDTGTTDTGQAIDASGDTSVPPDSSNGDDTTNDPCAAVNCGTNATCEQGQCICDPGFSGDPQQGCDPVETDPCEGVQCPFGSTCVGGNCPCDPGFSDDGAGGCQIDAVSDPTSRTEQEVCGRWESDYPSTASTMWTIEPVDQCDVGVLAPQQQRDALRRLNLYRWLAGLNPVTSKISYVQMTQECATTLNAYGSITHSIGQDFDCYTSDASTAAGSSNLAQGVRTPASSVGLYIDDRGVTSLGHRRWSLNPTMSATGFGQRGSISCMWSFDRAGSSNVEHVFWPPAGKVPMQAMPATWSMSSNSVRFGSDLSVTIEPAGGGDPVSVSNVQKLRNGYAMNTISWDVSSRDLTAGTEYIVTITGAGDAPLTYRVTPINC